MKISIAVVSILTFFSCSGSQNLISDSEPIEPIDVKGQPSENKSSKDSSIDVKLVLDQYGTYPHSIELKDSFIYVKLLNVQKNAEFQLQAFDYSNPRMRLTEERFHEYLLSPVIPGGEIKFTITYKGLNESENFTLYHKIKVE